jgi:5-formyltetrahydrofolate cyclo-ligase
MPEKSSLRSACLAKRDALSQTDHETFSFAACERLMTYLSTVSLSGRNVALYNPIKNELDITPVLHALYAEGISVALPVVESGQRALSFYRFHSTLALAEGAYGIYEPQQTECVQPDIVIVPLVGFDRALHRIGYGKGYYDATLAALRTEKPPLLAIGVGFALQEVESLPTETHDMRLDVIITEKETLTTDHCPPL